jgi:hypothetical protein
MKQTNLSVFYHLGKGVSGIDKVLADAPIAEAIFALFDTYAWLLNLVDELDGVDMPDTVKAAKYVMEHMDSFGDFRKLAAAGPPDRRITRDEIAILIGRFDWFERCFDREYRSLDVFTVTSKGIYDIRMLMSHPEHKFPERIRRVLPSQTLSDLKQAAKCLSFEIPTACAFHICRATEALMLYYYEVLTGHAWALPKNRDWKSYIDHLRNEGAPKSIVTRLDEIRDMDRNAYAHPDRNVTLEESPIQFELCTNVMFQMGSEIDKKINP